MKTVFLYVIGGLALIALAGAFPRVAIVFTLILIMGVIAMNASDYATLLSGLSPTTATAKK